MTRAPKLSPAQLSQLHPHELGALGGQRQSVLQVAALKSISGAPLDKAELRAWRRATGTTLAKPREEGYPEVVAEVGRRGGKSQHLATPLALWLAMRPATLSPGEVAIVALLAPERAQAARLLDGAAGLARNIGLRHERLSDRLKLPDFATDLLVVTSNEVSGRSPTCKGVVFDEAAFEPKLLDVLGAVEPAGATVEGFTVVLLSTPWSRETPHFKLANESWGKVRSGTLVLRGPSWLWNDTLTREKCRRLARSPRIFAREFCAEASDPTDTAFQPDQIKQCVAHGVKRRPHDSGARYAAGLDLASGGACSSALCIMHRELVVRQASAPFARSVVDFVGVWPSRKGEPGSAYVSRVVTEVAAALRGYGSPRVARDRFAGSFAGNLLQQAGVRTVEVDMQPGSQAARFQGLGDAIASNTIALLDHEQLIKELSQLRLELHDGGRLKYTRPRRADGRDDLADAVALAFEQVAALDPVSDKFRRKPVDAWKPDGTHWQLCGGGWEEWCPGLGRWLDSAGPPWTAEWCREARGRRSRGVFLPADYAADGALLPLPDDGSGEPLVPQPHPSLNLRVQHE